MHIELLFLQKEIKLLKNCYYSIANQLVFLTFAVPKKMSYGKSMSGYRKETN